MTTIFAEDMLIAGREDEWRRLASGFRELRQQLRLKFAGVVQCNDKLMKFSLKFVKTWMRTHPPPVEDELEIEETSSGTLFGGNAADSGEWQVYKAMIEITYVQKRGGRTSVSITSLVTVV